MRRLAAAAGIALALNGSAAIACGYCVEDKIASTYDHAVVTAALARHHHVAFYHIDGPIPPGDAAKRSLESLAESTPGVDKGSVRVAVETLTISFAFDPRRAPLLAVQTAMDRKFAAKKLALMPLKVIERAAEMKTVQR